MQRLEVQHTEDGSATLFVPEMDEHYHSVKGAYTEALHIYRDCAYLHAAERSSTNDCPLRLLEIGFGTGLNAAVTAMVTNAQHPVHYITLEKYPVGPSLVENFCRRTALSRHTCRTVGAGYRHHPTLHPGEALLRPDHHNPPRWYRHRLL